MVKSGMALFIVGSFVRAENTVYMDAAFPYRIVCKTAWVQEAKNDTILILKNSTPGKKTRFQLHKYSIDTGYNFENKEWSRLRWAINKELANGIGIVKFVDTTANKKLGNYRAFELFAYFSEKTEERTIWWAEYSRWTDHDGFGYLASIIGDTADMKDPENYTSYRTLMDSINISQMTTRLKAPRFVTTSPQRLPLSSVTWYNALGRDMRGCIGHSSMLLVKRSMKQFPIRRP